MSIYGQVELGSMLSLRGFSRMSSSISLGGLFRVGNDGVYDAQRRNDGLSIMGFTHLGSSLSLRSF